MTAEMNYHLRPLKASDFFLVTRILSKIGVKEFKACFENEAIKNAVKDMVAENGGNINEADIASVGMIAALDIASIVLEHAEGCEKDIYKLLSRLSGMNEQEIADLPMATFGEMVIDVVKHEGFRDFFTAAIKRLK